VAGHDVKRASDVCVFDPPKVDPTGGAQFFNNTGKAMDEIKYNVEIGRFGHFLVNSH
jgi:hypothetical protein